MKFKFIMMLALCLILVTMPLMAQKEVHNGDKGTWGSSPKVSISLKQTIGGLDVEDEELMFYMPSDVACDADGNMYVVDTGNYRIQKLTKDGKFSASFGQEGQGPGDFTRARSIDIDAEGNLYIADEGNNRVQVLAPNGTSKLTVPLENGASTTRLLPSGDLLMPAGSGMMMFGEIDLDNLQAPSLLALISPEGETNKTIGMGQNFNEFMLNRMANSFFFAIENGENIYLAYQYQNLIEKRDMDGNVLWSSDRELNYSAEIPEPEESIKVSDEGGQRAVRLSMPDLDYVTLAADLDSKGRLWVVTMDRQLEEDEEVQQMMSVTMENGARSTSVELQGATDMMATDALRLEVYNSDGVLLGILPLTHFVNSMRIFGDRMFFVDEIRGMMVYEYSISEK